MDSINFELKPGKHKVSIEIEIEDIIDRMNKLDLLVRWQLIKKIIDNLNTNNFEVMTSGQKFMVIDFLEKNLKLYKFGIKK